MSSAKKVVVVTGAGGQLGRLVVSRLLEKETVSEVRAIDLVEPSLTHKKLKSIVIDIRSSELKKHFAGVDVVIHLAFVVTHYLPREEFDDINVHGSRLVFEAAANQGVRQIVYASSIAAYGVCVGHTLPLKEDAARVHVQAFPYSSAKFRVEQFLDQFETKQPALRIVRLRPSILVGQNMNNPLSALFAQALRKGYLVGNDSAPMPLVWDEDVAEACILAVDKNAHGAYNISAEKLLTSKEIAESLGLRTLDPKGPLKLLLDAIAVAKARFGVKDAIDPAWSKYGDIPMSSCINKAKDELGWTPRYATSVEIIRAFLDYVGTGAKAKENTNTPFGTMLGNVSREISKRILGRTK